MHALYTYKFLIMSKNKRVLAKRTSYIMNNGQAVNINKRPSGPVSLTWCSELY